MDFAPPNDCDVLREWLRDLPAIERPLEAKRNRPSGTTISSSTGGEGMYRAAYLEEMPFPLEGAVSKTIMEELTARAWTVLTILPPPR